MPTPFPLVSPSMVTITRIIRSTPQNILWGPGNSELDASVGSALSSSLPRLFKAMRFSGIVLPGSPNLTGNHGPGKILQSGCTAVRVAGRANGSDRVQKAFTSPGGRLTRTSATSNSNMAVFWMTAAQRAALYGGDPYQDAACVNWRTGLLTGGDTDDGTLFQSNNPVYFDVTVNDAGVIQAGGASSLNFSAYVAVGLAHVSGTVAKVGTNNPSVYVNWGTIPSTGGAGAKDVTINGFKLFSDVPGTKHCFLAHSSAGWADYNNNDTGIIGYQAASIDKFMEFCEGPTVLFFFLGTNNGGDYDFTTSAQFKNYYGPIIDLWAAAAKARNGGIEPLIGLISPHNTSRVMADQRGGSIPRKAEYYELMAQATYELAATRTAAGKLCGSINGYQLVPSTQALCPSDGVHFDQAGADEFVNRINQALDDAIAADDALPVSPRRKPVTNSSSPQRRYLLNGSAQTAWSLSAGRTTTAPWEANANHQAISVSGLRGLTLTPFADGANNVVVEYRVWAVNSTRVSGGVQTNEYVLRPMAYGSFTLGQALGVGGVIAAAERLADTASIVLTSASDGTLKGPGAVIKSTLAEGSCDVYSPADDSAALISLGTLFRAEQIIIEFKVPSAATKANVAYDALPV